MDPEFLDSKVAVERCHIIGCENLISRRVRSMSWSALRLVWGYVTMRKSQKRACASLMQSLLEVAERHKIIPARICTSSSFSLAGHVPSSIGRRFCTALSRHFGKGSGLIHTVHDERKLEAMSTLMMYYLCVLFPGSIRTSCQDFCVILVVWGSAPQL